MVNAGFIPSNGNRIFRPDPYQFLLIIYDEIRIYLDGGLWPSFHTRKQAKGIILEIKVGRMSFQTLNRLNRFI